MEHGHYPKYSYLQENSHGHVHADAKTSHAHRPREKKLLLATLLLTGSFMLVEFAAGWIVHSMALISDAGHMLTHLGALLVSYLALCLAAKPGSQKNSFGFFRSEVIAAFFNGITLLFIVIVIFVGAVYYFIHPKPILVGAMFWVALIGLFVNAVSALILLRAEQADYNIRSAFLHMLGDTASSVAIVVGAVLIGWTGWLWIDPVLSVAISILIAKWSVGLIKDSVRVLLEATPPHIPIDLLKNELRSRFPEILDIHDIHAWEITAQMYSFTAHIVVKDCMLRECEIIRKKLVEYLDRQFHITHTSLQFETLNG